MIESIDKLISSRGNIFLNKSIENIDKEVNGIYFMYSSWSHSFLQLKYLIASLQEFPDISLYIFNTDDLNTEKIKSMFNVYSDGWGETFWIKKGQIISFLKKYAADKIEELTKNNKEISQSSAGV